MMPLPLIYSWLFVSIGSTPANSISHGLKLFEIENSIKNYKIQHNNYLDSICIVSNLEVIKVYRKKVYRKKTSSEILYFFKQIFE